MTAQEMAKWDTQEMENSDSSCAGSGLIRRVRTAAVADIPALVPLINAAFAVETFFEGTRTDETRLAAMMEKGAVLAAEDESGRLIASVYTELRGRRGYLGMLAVDPAHQGKGLGRAMTEAVEEHFRRLGCEGLDLTVLNVRTELPPIHRKLGFVETGTEEFHPAQPLKAGVDLFCIVMSKKL